MFDTYKVTHLTPPGYKYVEVTEKRAPTDESVRLLREMEEKARSQVIKSVQLDSNVVNAQVWKLYDPLGWKNKFGIVVNLNGKKILVETETDPSDDKDKQLRAIYEALSERIAAEIMPNVYSEVFKGGLL